MLFNDLSNKIYETVFSSFTEDCTVPTYIVHHSGNSNDYSIYFQVEEITEKLQEGIFTTPKIEIWSGRSDLDRKELSKRLRQEFISQLNLEKEKKQDKYRLNKENASKDKMQRKNKLHSKVAWLGSSIAAVLLVSNPIANAILLLIAVSSGKSTLSEIIHILRLSISSQITGSSKENNDSELESIIKHKTNTIDEALANMEIKLHPKLYKAAHENYGIETTPAKGIVLKADKLPRFIEGLIARETF